MARKKKYQDGELEQEFTRFAFYHKYITIQTALLMYEKDGIYNCKQLEPFKDIEDESSARKAVMICNKLTDQHDAGDDTMLDELYQYCWDRLSPSLTEHSNFTEGFKATD